MVFTVLEASQPDQLGRSPNWIRAGIKLGKIKARKAGKTYIIDGAEVKRVKANPPIITRQEMRRC